MNENADYVSSDSNQPHEIEATNTIEIAESNERLVTEESESSGKSPLNPQSSSDPVDSFDDYAIIKQLSAIANPIQRESFSRAAIAAIKQNLIPGLILQGCGLFIVILYFSSAAVKDAMDSLAELKIRSGYLFSAISTAIFAGILPCLIQQFQHLYEFRNAGVIPSRNPSFLSQFIFLTCLWAFKGIDVDAFYRFQALLFGTDNDPGTIALKVFFDQFIYNPIWAVHSMILPYTFKDCNYSFMRTYEKLASSHYFTFLMPSTLIAGWIVWIPACSLIYCMPSTLQIPLFEFVIAFWGLMIAMVTRGGASEKALRAESVDYSKVTTNPSLELVNVNEFEDDDDP